MIGILLANLRKKSKMTQVQLAETLGIDQSTISHIERETRDTTNDVIERWISACDGTLLILGPGEAPNPLSSLSPQQMTVVETMEAMNTEDASRLVGVAQALRTTDGLARDLLVGQLDAIVGATRKSAGSDRIETRRA